MRRFNLISLVGLMVFCFNSSAWASSMPVSDSVTKTKTDHYLLVADMGKKMEAKAEKMKAKAEAKHEKAMEKADAKHEKAMEKAQEKHDKAMEKAEAKQEKAKEMGKKLGHDK